MKTVVYCKETGEVSGVYDGSFELSRELRKFQDSITVNPANGFNLEDVLHLIPNHSIQKPKYTQLYSSIIPPDTEHVIIERDRTGLGDTVSLLSAIQQLRKDFPDIKITLRAWVPYLQMLENHPDIDRLEDSKTTTPQMLGDKEILIDVGNKCPAGDYETARQSLTDKSRNEIFTIALGLRWRGEEPKFHLTEEEKLFGYKFVKDKSDDTKGNLAVVLRSAEPWKDWPYTEEFCELSLSKYNVFTIDQTMILDIDGIHNLAADQLKMRELMSVLPYMDCVVSPDTGIMHMCDALDVQCLSLFGSMIGKLYNEKYENTLSIVQGECVLGKSPCFYEVCEGKANYQPCMSSIKPQYITQLVNGIVQQGVADKFNQVSATGRKSDGFLRRIGLRA